MIGYSISLKLAGVLLGFIGVLGAGVLLAQRDLQPDANGARDAVTPSQSTPAEYVDLQPGLGIRPTPWEPDTQVDDVGDAETNDTTDVTTPVVTTATTKSTTAPPNTTPGPSPEPSETETSPPVTTPPVETTPPAKETPSPEPTVPTIPEEEEEEP